MPIGCRTRALPEAVRRRQRLSINLALWLAIVLAPGLGHCYGHDEAKRLRETGQILPLQEVLRRHGHRRGRRVLDVELNKRQGRYIYEVETLDNRGKVRRDYFDATTGQPLGPRQRK